MFHSEPIRTEGWSFNSSRGQQSSFQPLIQTQTPQLPQLPQLQTASLFQPQLPQQIQPQQSQPHYSQSFLPSTSTQSIIKATLLNQELWQSFSRVGTEMILTRPGRRMFPTLKVRLEGLEPEKKYVVMVDLMPADQHRYKFTNQQWLVAGRAEIQFRPNRIFVHSDSPATGSHWNAEEISFHKVKLTNNISDTNGHIILNSQHKYIPRVHLVEGEDLDCLTSGRHQTFVFPETAFIAVTAYQNEGVTRLKIENNPFAKAFRQRSVGSKKRKSGDDEDEETDNIPAVKSSKVEEQSRCVKNQVVPDVVASPSETDKHDSVLNKTSSKQSAFQTSTPILNSKKPLSAFTPGLHHDLPLHHFLPHSSSVSSSFPASPPPQLSSSFVPSFQTPSGSFPFLPPSFSSSSSSMNISDSGYASHLTPLFLNLPPHNQPSFSSSFHKHSSYLHSSKQHDASQSCQSYEMSQQQHTSSFNQRQQPQQQRQHLQHLLQHSQLLSQQLNSIQSQPSHANLFTNPYFNF